MHELSLANALLGLITRTAQENGNQKVQSALLEVGAMTHVEPETLRFAFEAISRDTPTAGCTLVFRRVPITAECPQCSWRGETQEGICGQCGAWGLRVLTGRELRLVSIDVED